MMKYQYTKMQDTIAETKDEHETEKLLNGALLKDCSKNAPKNEFAFNSPDEIFGPSFGVKKNTS